MLSASHLRSPKSWKEWHISESWDFRRERDLRNSIVPNTVSEVYYIYFTSQLFKVFKYSVTFIISLGFFVKKTALFLVLRGSCYLAQASCKQNSFCRSLLRWRIWSSCYLYKIQERAVEYLVQMVRNCATGNWFF